MLTYADICSRLDAPELKIFLRSASDGPFESRDIVVNKRDSYVSWQNTKQAYVTDADSAQVSFTLHAADHKGPDGANHAYGQLSVGCSGTYKRLSLCLTRQGLSSKVIDLEMRMPDASSTRQKRKRPELAFETSAADE